MPSIRVKRDRYSSLGEGSSPAQPVQRRARSQTIDTAEGGRVRDYIDRKPLRRHTHGFLSLRRPRHHSLHNNANRPSQDELVTIQGETEDVQVHHRVGDAPLGFVGSALSLPSSSSASEPRQEEREREGEQRNAMHHHDDIVEHLDAIDPQVATVSNLTNAANAILIPPFFFDSRRPIVVLNSPAESQDRDAEKGRRRFSDDLDRHVDDVLNKRARIRRSLKGIWSFLKTPMGIATGIYGFCVVFWGAAIVFFLGKIINLHNNDLQGFWVEVSCQVTNGLFTLTGIGLIPSRILDTYRISKIIHYKRKTRRLRREAGLPALLDEDDLPDPIYDPLYVHVLTEKEQMDLHYQQDRFHHHQTWYRAHGTETHRAFPINYAMLICLFNDGNSIFQALLCGCMWGMNRFLRPAWTTGSLIPLSFVCGILSAVFIGYGSSKTKRTEKVEKTLRDALDALDLNNSNNAHSESEAESGMETETETRNGGPNRGKLERVDENETDPMQVEQEPPLTGDVQKVVGPSEELKARI